MRSDQRKELSELTELLLFEIPEHQTSFSTKEVIEITGFSKEALRYYEKLDILGTIPRNQNNYRQYSQSNLQRLQMVKVFQYLGMSLSLLGSISEQDSQEKHLKILREYQASIQERMKQLNEIDQFIEQKIQLITAKQPSKKNS
ncbi:MerR family transcriptional regulator [Enterococcus lactis]|uniref:MerR family transcriptional regulator n=1 Tax=Enterococcus lactis TaxID=357441 RepID=UPI0022E523B8|nr:MerR family transcriptional regulator [Enterococcus lactis]